jgi:hypothetical protein
MGHTPRTQIEARCGGTVILIDTGISRAYGGRLSAAEIMYTLSPLPPRGPAADGGEVREREWMEREVVNALYEDEDDPVELVREQRTLWIPSRR